MKPLLCIVSGVIGLIVGVLGMLVLSQWALVAPAFFQINIVQCLQLLVTLVVGTVLSLWVQAISGNRARLMRVYESLLDAIECKLGEAYDECGSYMRGTQKTKAKQRDVVAKLKVLSFRISLCEKADVAKGGRQIRSMATSLKQQYQSMKSTVTGGTFGRADSTYTAEEIAAVDKAHEEMTGCLLNARLTLHL